MLYCAWRAAPASLLSLVVFSVCSTETPGLTAETGESALDLLVLDLSVGRSLSKMSSQPRRTRASTVQVEVASYRQLETEEEGDEEAGKSPASPPTRRTAPDAPELPTWLPDREVQEEEAPAWFESEWYVCQVGLRYWHR